MDSTDARAEQIEKTVTEQLTTEEEKEVHPLMNKVFPLCKTTNFLVFDTNKRLIDSACASAK